MGLTDEVASAVSDLSEALAEGRVRDLTHDELTDLVVTARREQARLESVVLVAVGEIDARGSHVHDGALSTPAWLRMCTRVTPGEATASTRTARVLRSGSLPATSAALARGEISWRHAHVIAEGVADAPAGATALIESEALAAARTADVRAVSGVMRQFRHALDPDGVDESALHRYERRGLTLSPTLDGSLAITGLADEVSGSVIATAVNTAAPLVTGDRRSAAQRRLDGLVELCRRFLDSPDTPRAGGGGHPHIIVTLDAHTLHANLRPDDEPAAADRDTNTHSVPPGGAADSTAEVPPGWPGPWPGSPGATLSWIGHIGGSTARRVACDAHVTTVGLGPDGEVIHTLNERRYFTPAQRRAMIARDGDRCFWPWCDRPSAWSERTPPARMGGRRPHHRGQRRSPLPWTSHSAPRRRLEGPATTRRALRRATTRRSRHRPRASPTRTQPPATTARETPLVRAGVGPDRAAPDRRGPEVSGQGDGTC